MEKLQWSLDELKDQLSDLQCQLGETQTKLDDLEIDPDEYEDSYIDCLDDQGDVIIGSLRYSPSRVLREVDPIAYRCGLND